MARVLALMAQISWVNGAGSKILPGPAPRIGFLHLLLAQVSPLFWNLLHREGARETVEAAYCPSLRGGVCYSETRITRKFDFIPTLESHLK